MFRNQTYELLIKEIEESGYHYVELKQIAKRYYELKKIRLSQLKRKYAEASGRKKPPDVLCESLAYSDPDYEEFLDQWMDAEKTSEKARIKYEALKNRFDAYRSEQAYEREKLGRGIL